MTRISSEQFTGRDRLSGVFERINAVGGIFENSEWAAPFHYERANELDSVTVDYREAVSPGLWYVRHERTFPVEDLRNVR